MTELHDKLRLFISKVYSIYHSILTERPNLRLATQPKFRWQIRNFAYTEKGVVSQEATGTMVDLPDPTPVAIHVAEQLEKDPTYEQYVTTLKEKAPLLADPRLALSNLASRLVACKFAGGPTALEQTEALLDRFVQQSIGGPIQYQATVHLKGIVLIDDEVRLNDSALLRRPKKSDFEEPFDSKLTPQHGLRIPSAILEICIPGNIINIPNMWDEVHKYCTFLRLFGVGSVTWLLYNLHSDAAVSFRQEQYNSTTSSPTSTTPTHAFPFASKDEALIQLLFKMLDTPRTYSLFAISREINFLTIAYERYTEALLESAILERNISNAVMGLEAIYSNDSSELTYKISVRIAKALTLFGGKGLQIKSEIVEGYKIRSKFVHGDQLSSKDKNKLCVKYGSEAVFLTRILDYLRISLNLLILCQITSKNELINLLDNALLDESSRHDLSELLKPATSICKMTFVN